MLQGVHVSVPVHDDFILSRCWVSINGFILVMGFIGLLQAINATNYAAVANSYIYSSLQHALSLLILLCLHQFPGNGIQCRRSLSFRVQPLLSSLSIAYLTTRLGVAMQRLMARLRQGTNFCDDLRRVCLPTVNCRLLDFSRIK
jgi:hypothetical protein